MIFRKQESVSKSFSCDSTAFVKSSFHNRSAPLSGLARSRLQGRCPSSSLHAANIMINKKSMLNQTAMQVISTRLITE